MTLLATCSHEFLVPVVNYEKLILIRKYSLRICLTGAIPHKDAKASPP
jgi:hypothetical protein